MLNTINVEFEVNSNEINAEATRRKSECGIITKPGARRRRFVGLGIESDECNGMYKTHRMSRIIFVFSDVYEGS